MSYIHCLCSIHKSYIGLLPVLTLANRGPVVWVGVVLVGVAGGGVL